MPIQLAEHGVVIPDGIVDLDAYRDWVNSETYPEHFRTAYLDGNVWVETSMEQAFTHNRLKTLFAAVLFPLAESEGLGDYFGDGMLVSNPQTNLGHQPDGLFVSKKSWASGAVKQLGADGCLEFVGSPDMVLEVVSKSSVTKDTVELPELCYAAGVGEYWLVDARQERCEFKIYRRGPEGFEAVSANDGWVRSEVFGRAFLLTRTSDENGNPRFGLAVL